MEFTSAKALNIFTESSLGTMHIELRRNQVAGKPQQRYNRVKHNQYSIGSSYHAVVAEQEKDQLVLPNTVEQRATAHVAHHTKKLCRCYHQSTLGIDYRAYKLKLAWRYPRTANSNGECRREGKFSRTRQRFPPAWQSG